MQLFSIKFTKADYQSEQITMEEVRLDELLLDARELVLKAHPDYHIELVFEQEAEEDNVLTVIGNSYLLTTAFVSRPYLYHFREQYSCFLRDKTV